MLLGTRSQDGSSANFVAVFGSQVGIVITCQVSRLERKHLPPPAPPLALLTAVVSGCWAGNGGRCFTRSLLPPPVQAVASGLQAGKVVGAVAKVCGGGGGGKPGLAQAGGKDATRFEEAMELARKSMGLSL